MYSGCVACSATGKTASKFIIFELNHFLSLASSISLMSLHLCLSVLDSDIRLSYNRSTPDFYVS